MRTTCIAGVLFALLAPAAFAGGESHYVFAFSGSKSTAVALEKDADYVCMSLTIHSSEKEPTQRFAEIKQAQDLILARAKDQPGLLIHKGVISLSPEPAAKISPISSSSALNASAARLHVMAKLDAYSDVYACATRIRRFFDSITMPGKSTYTLGEIQVAVADPEQYRQEILRKISADVAFVKETMQTSGTVSITGLEQPVLVRQVDDRKVELFINYSMTMELSNEKTEGEKK